MGPFIYIFIKLRMQRRRNTRAPKKRRRIDSFQVSCVKSFENLLPRNRKVLNNNNIVRPTRIYNSLLLQIYLIPNRVASWYFVFPLFRMTHRPLSSFPSQQTQQQQKKKKENRRREWKLSKGQRICHDQQSVRRGQQLAIPLYLVGLGFIPSMLERILQLGGGALLLHITTYGSLYKALV